MRAWEVAENGLFLADANDITDENLGPQHITVAPPQGLRWPKWEGTAPDNGKWVEGKPLTIDEAKKIREQEIRAEGQQRLLAIAEPYEAAERETWSGQLAEAEAYLVNETASTPLLDAMAKNRGIEKGLLVSKVIENANLFRVGSGNILGQQQALLDQLSVAKSVEDVQAVVW